MNIGSLKKRLIKLGRSLHRSMDNSPEATEITGLVDNLEKSVGSAKKNVQKRSQRDVKASKAFDAVVEEIKPKPTPKKKKK